MSDIFYYRQQYQAALLADSMDQLPGEHPLGV
jgi:hypothetical protein